MRYYYDGILYSSKNKWIVSTYINTDESPKRLNDENKSELYTECGLIYEIVLKR